MATINPVSTSLGMSISLGVVDGKTVEKVISVTRVNDSITADAAKSLVNTLKNLLEYPVTATKKNSVGLLAD